MRYHPAMSGSAGDQPLPPDADQRAIHILRCVMGIVSEIALDLDVTWSQARELFAATLFERAEGRYATAPRIASALDTSLRTVKQYRHRRREDEAAPPPPTFNMRRRVLHLLDQGPRTLAEIEEQLPVGSDVNYARSAVQSLLEDGLVVTDEASGQLRQPDESFVPWYLRSELHPGEQLELFCDNFAALLGSRITPKGEQATIPAMVGTMILNMPEELVKEYIDELGGLIADFDTRWNERLKDRQQEDGNVLAGAVLTVGEIGEAMTPEQIERLERRDPRHLMYDDDVSPTYRRFYDEKGRRLPREDDDGDETR